MENKQYVGFWDRFHAAIVTTILLSIIEMGISYLFFDDFFMEDIELFGLIDIVIGHIIPMIITVLIWIKYSSDPGKMLYKAKIVDATTFEKPTIKQFIIRYIGYYISLLPLGLGYFWVIWDDKKQAWHDKLAHTVVIKPKEVEEKVKWYVTIYRVFVSILFAMIVAAAILYYFIPKTKPLEKVEDVNQVKITQLLDADLITDKSDLVYYYEEDYLWEKLSSSVIAITKEGICIMYLKDSNITYNGCYKFQDIGHLGIKFEDEQVYLFDKDIYTFEYRLSDEYYDENSTQNGLFLNMMINEEYKKDFNTTVLKLWKEKHKKIE